MARARELLRDLVRLYGLLRAGATKEGLSLLQGQLLGAIGAGTTTVNELAAFLRVTKSTISRSVKQLRQRGLVEIAVNPNDARCKVISLTALGRTRLRRLDSQQHAKVRGVLSDMNRQSRATAIKGLELFVNAMAEKPFSAMED